MVVILTPIVLRVVGIPGFIYTLTETNTHKESNRPTIHFQVRTVSFREGKPADFECVLRS